MCFLHAKHSYILSIVCLLVSHNEEIVSPHGNILGSDSRPSQFLYNKASLT
jgi:hypothetical protein